MISKWIDKLDEIKNVYKFKLLFRGSRDELTRRSFHENCDNQSRTVSIIKVKDSNEILGGYNPIIWKSNYSFGTTKDSFIFSFKKNNRISDYILSRIKTAEYAVYNHSLSGPSFGANDLNIWPSYLRIWSRKFSTSCQP